MIIWGGGATSWAAKWERLEKNMEAPRQKHVFVGQMFQADAFYKTHQGQQQLDGAIDSDRLKVLGF